MNILVTGGDGFIGTHLIKRLNSLGHDVVSMDYKRFRSRVGDYIPYNQYDVIYHLAALTNPSESMSRPVTYVDYNINDTASFFQQISSTKHCPGRVILASSSTIYGDGVNLDESAPIRPFTPYAISKYAQERLLECYIHQARICSVILRLPVVYGPGQSTSGVCAKFLDMFRKKESPPIYGSGSQLRNFLYIDDCIDALVLAINPLTDMSIFNVTSNESWTVLGMATQMYQMTSKEVGPPPTLINIHRKWDSQHLTMNDSYAREWLKFSPKYGLLDGLKKYIEEEKQTK